MNSEEMRLEIERLKAQVREARIRIADVEIVADRLTMRLNHFEQDNLPTTPFNAIPQPDEIDVEIED
jgi:phosphoribosylaminoimidazole carboxylase (NCAIR synthetase)